MDNKYLNLSLNKKITFGLAWLLWPVAVLVLIFDKDKLDHQDKKEIITSLVCNVAACIIGLIYIVNVIEAIKIFTNKEAFEVPLASKLAEKFIK